MAVQSVLFDSHKWTIPRAKKWLTDNNYKIIKVHTTDNFHRFRQINPNPDKKYRTINIGNGIELLIMY